MSQKFYKKHKSLLKTLKLLAWMLVGFYTAQILVIGGIYLLKEVGVQTSSINKTLFVTIITTIIYLVAILIVIGAPKFLKRNQTTLKEIGLNSLPKWRDIFIAPISFFIYLFLSVILMAILTWLFPQIDINQAQNTGFENLSQYFEYLLAFIALVVVAPVAEEILFRDYLYNKLKSYTKVWVAIILTSLLFGAVHGALNIAIDTFALSVVLCVLRERTGSLWASILLHMIKNGIAYYFLFINPLLLTTLVK